MMYSNISNITQKWVDILIPFTNKYNSKITASELTKITKIPQQTISRVLNELLKLNIIKFETNGKNKYYFLDSYSNSSKIILNILESKKSLDFHLNNPKISILINEILKYCDSLIIFGSYANYKNNKSSDLDLIIIEGNEKEIKKIKNKQIIDINYENINYQDLENSIKEKKPLLIEIKQNHIFYGEVSKLINIFLKNE